MRDTIYQNADKFLFPRPPRSGTRCNGICFCERIQKSKTSQRSNRFSNERNCSVIGKVSPGGGVGKQKMVATHLLKNQCVGSVETHAGGNLRNQFNADIGVIAWAAFADVMQECSNHQKVGTIDAINQRRRIRSGLT